MAKAVNDLLRVGEAWTSRRAHNAKNADSNSAPATNYTNTPGLGSNGERRQARDVLKPARMITRSRLVVTFAGSGGNAFQPRVENPVMNRLSGRSCGKTGYESVENSCQVPSPTYTLTHTRENRLSESPSKDAAYYAPQVGNHLGTSELRHCFR